MAAFDKIGLCSELASAVTDMGWLLPTNVQDDAIPYILNGKDVMVAAETGSGKTGAFALPALQVVYEELRSGRKAAARAKNMTSVPDMVFDRTISDSQVHIAGLTVASVGNWAGARTSWGVAKGKYYYEVTCVSDGLIRVGWATQGGKLNLGNDNRSMGYGFTGKKSFNREFESYPSTGLQTYGASDVIGCFVDLDRKFTAYSVNGKYLKEAHRIPNTFTAVFPAFCAKKGGKALYNFGATPFQYPPGSGFKAIQEAKLKDTTFVFGDKESKSSSADGKPYCFIIEPTKDLANQVYEECCKFSKYLTQPAVHCALVSGGGHFGSMVDSAKRAHLIVGTLGSLVGVVKGGKVKLDRCKFFIIDEADQLCTGRQSREDLKNIRALWSRCPSSRQTMLFSATLHSKEIKEVGNVLCDDPIWVDLKGKDYVPDTVNHSIIIADPVNDQRYKRQLRGLKTDAVHAKDKINFNTDPKTWTHETASEAVKRLKLIYLKDVIDTFEMNQALIFCRTKVDCHNCYRWLVMLGGGREFQGKGSGGLENKYSCLQLHGDIRPAQQRTENLKCFRDGDVRFLICTDVAARGIDVQGLPFVINVTMPAESPNYLHRVGRVGRAGRKGLAISIVSPVKEKVWYHANCKSRGNCFQTHLVKQGGCCIWYDEKQLVKEVEGILKMPLPNLKPAQLVKGKVKMLMKSLEVSDPEMKRAADNVKKKQSTVQKLSQMEVDCQNMFLSMPRKWSKAVYKRRQMEEDYDDL